MAYAPDGSWAAWALPQKNQLKKFCEVLVTGAPRFEERQRIRFEEQQVRNLEVSPDPRWLVIEGKNRIVGHDLKGQEESFYGPELDDVAWFRVSPGAELLALVRCGSPGVFLVEARGGDVVKAFGFGGEKAESLAFSLDGRYLAVGLGDWSVRLIDLRLQHEVASLAGHYGRVRWVEFAATTGVLCSAGEEGTILCWDHDRITGGSVRHHASGDARV